MTDQQLLDQLKKDLEADLHATGTDLALLLSSERRETVVTCLRRIAENTAAAKLDPASAETFKHENSYCINAILSEVAAVGA